jgi:O-antigen/teichoic acid export membrane protein
MLGFKYYLLFNNNIKKIKFILGTSLHDKKTIEGKSNERYRRILLTGITTGLVKVVSVLINLFTVPLTLKYLGSERYGLWMSISSILALLSFADLGLGNGLLNTIAQASARNKVKEAKIAVSSTFYLLLFISTCLFIFFILIFNQINWISVFNVKSELAKIESGRTMFVLVTILLINMPLGIVQRIQEGYQEGYRFQIWLILGSLLSLLFLVISIYFKLGLPILVFSLSIGPILSTFLNAIEMFKNKRRLIFPSWRYFDFKIGKKLIKSGLAFLLLGIFTLIGNSSDDIIIAHTLGSSDVAAYEVVKKIFLFSMFTQFLIQPLWPAFAEAIEIGDINWAKKTLNKGFKLSLIFGGLLSIPLVIFGKSIILFWVGPDYVPSYSLLFGFFVFVLTANYGGVMSTFLNSGPLLAKQTIMIGLAACTSLILKVILSKYFGISAIIWSTVIGYSIFYIFPSYKLAYNYLNKKNEKIN